VLPITGCGAVIVDQDYLGLDSLVYAPADGCPIVGANIYVFPAALFEEDGTDTNRNLAVGATTTRVNGRWSQSLRLDPGDYVILYEKPGEYGPDTTELTVTPPALDEALEAWAPISTIPEPTTNNTSIPKLRSPKSSSDAGKKENKFWDI
jgi:hypothetical protein